MQKTRVVKNKKQYLYVVFSAFQYT